MSRKRSSSSKKWLSEHFTDPYVKQAHKDKRRSRAWFKLDSINSNFKLFKKGMKVIDLGSSPGSWSEYASKKIGQSGNIIACDMIPMSSIPNVKFIQGDITNKFYYNLLFNIIKDKNINLIMSDMAPNISGHNFLDHLRIIHLNKIVLQMSKRILSKNGQLLIKSFHGSEFNIFIKNIYNIFIKINIFKPNASRARSKEVYILASGRKCK